MFRTLISDSVIFFRQHFYPIAAIILPIIIPFELFATFYQHFFIGDELAMSDQLILMIVALLIYPVYAGGLVFYIASVLRRESIDNRTAWRLAMANWSRYLFVTVLVGAAVMFGLFLLIVPGIILAARYAFAEFELLLDGYDPFNAIKQSWQLTREHMWHLAGGFVLITFVLYLPYALLEFMVSPDTLAYWFIGGILNALVSLFGALYTIFAFRIYDTVKPQQPPEAGDSES
ncbi:Uncharacterised protein family (UPF0259) [Marinobacter daqiaonensis]|uniref:Uncharacterized protein family (UPF0259) n=1 Tax=Marinobacter daqiaonensis TaxID=650891 RepID=A0A1I6GIY2_9GAMM|nr:hypothetical protein [Marinobacter daqiaonensis]SFR42099.1 Uncharacterised protein family (UPF0259) [Marinobacter daqiaonensis]